MQKKIIVLYSQHTSFLDYFSYKRYLFQGSSLGLLELHFCQKEKIFWNRKTFLTKLIKNKLLQMTLIWSQAKSIICLENKNCQILRKKIAGVWCSSAWTKSLVGRTNEWVANPLGPRQTSALLIKTRSAKLFNVYLKLKIYCI